MVFEVYIRKNRVNFLADAMERKRVRDIAINAEVNSFQQIERVFLGNKEKDFSSVLKRILSKNVQHGPFLLVPDLPSHKDQGVMKQRIGQGVVIKIFGDQEV